MKSTSGIASEQQVPRVAEPANEHAKSIDSTGAEEALTRRATYISLVVGVVLLAVKFWGYSLTGSQAVFSDAMESIVNVVAAFSAIVVVAMALKPADQDHPYGHGKLEFFSAAFEGGLIAFASLLICAEAIQALFRGSDLREIDLGLGIVIGAGLGNLALGAFLVRTGRRHHSAALVASGQHVMSDFWTSAGIGVGLLLVKLTGLTWLDPAVAFVVGAWLGLTGFTLVRRSVGGLLDEKDREILESLLEAIEAEDAGEVIQVHHCRVIRAGRFHHIDAHAVVPEFWNVAIAHERTEAFEQRLMQRYRYVGELHLHVDPCRRAYCRHCEVQDCPIRVEPFRKRRPISIEELTFPEEPPEFRES